MRKLANGIQVLEPADYRRMRWKNGGGWTTEIAVGPADAGLNGKPFDWRISVAEIEQDGDFSAFAGYDRTILVADGAGMELHFNAAPTERLGNRSQPVRFKGEWRTHCHLLNGPVRDFNVMTARARWQHECHVARGGGFQLAAAPDASVIVVHCLRGSVELDNHAEMRFGLQARETLIGSGAATTQRFDTAMSGTETVLVKVNLKRLNRN